MNKVDSDELLVVGKITGCFGIKGWVKVHPYTEVPESFGEFGDWQLKRRGEYENVVFDAVKAQGKGLVAHIRGVDDRTLAEQVRCRDGDEKVLLGSVDYLIETGANDVLVVKACEGSIDKRERLIPYLPDDTVVRVDLDEGLIEVDWFVDEE